MNALSWGWWIDRVYDFNDADHVVLRDATEGENRARVTSSVITGLFITGDDFSKDGDADAKRRALSMLTNPDINTIANGRSFRPLNGDDDRSENIFIRHEENGDIYLAVFNYGENPLTMALPTDRMELDPRASYDITELWSQQKQQAQQQFRLPGKDAMVFLLKVRK
jgi:alpha-galactosidase